MTDSRSNWDDSDDEVLSPLVGKRLKLETSAPTVCEASHCPDKEQFTSFLHQEEFNLLSQCKNCLAELFFLENGSIIDYFNWQEGGCSNPALQKIIEEFEKSLSDQQIPSTSVDSIEGLLNEAPPVSEPSGQSVSSLAHRPTNITVPDLSPRSSVASPRNRLLSPVPAVSGTGSHHGGSPSRGSCSPLSPSRQTRHLTSEPTPSEAPASVDQSNNLTLPPTAGALTPQPSYSPVPQSISAVKEPQENAAERAKHDAEILRRVAELQREGLWSAKRLPRCAEPSRPKCHWDSLLEEMVWMSTDFAEEKRWKKAVAKKIAQAVCRHVNETGLNITLGCDEASNEASEATPEDIAIRACRSIAVMIEEFWAQMLRIASWRIESRMAEKHKRERDKHLDFIVGQTEKFSNWLSEGLLQPPVTILDQDEERMKVNELQSETSSLVKQAEERHEDDDEDESKDGEFIPEDASEEMDDEETIARAEAAEEGGQAEEVDALRAEAEMGVDDLLASLPPEYLSQLGLKDAVFSQVSSTDQSSSTLSSRRRRRGDAPESNQPSSDPLGDNIAKEEKEHEQQQEEKVATPVEQEMSSTTVEEENKLAETEMADSTFRRQRLDNLTAVASSMQPSAVRTTVPFLLRGGDLREYQRVGLDWMVMLNEKHINGILADEMGLGKTIQTIALLAHLACVKGIWGPHIIIVPASVLLNWEMEFKRWLPAFKVLTYYGSVKERKEKRRGWTDPNAFHICITSYQLAVIDHSVLRRRHWNYMILDEAQNIKNFRSRRWQALLAMQSQHRLLLTGTPLQNSLMELWSLMHFLMPQLFQSSDDFRDWFANPLASMVEGDREFSENLIQRLHKVLRPFLLRRLKKDVERQLPSKVEHMVSCRLSRRQRFLYDDFMSRASTRAVLQGGAFVSVLGVLVQLRKVCNHPDLFEPRPVISPLVMPDPIVYSAPFLLAELKDRGMSEQSLEWLIGEHIRQPSLCGVDYDRRFELCPSQQAFYDAYTSPTSPVDLPRSSRNDALNALVQRRIRLQAFRSLSGDVPVAADIGIHSQDLVNGGGKNVGRLAASSQLRPPGVVYPLKWGQDLPLALTNGLGSAQDHDQKPFIEICTRLEVADASAIAIPPADVVRRVCAEENETAVFLAKLNEQRCRLLSSRPLFGLDLIRSVSLCRKSQQQKASWRTDFDHFKQLNLYTGENSFLPLLQVFAFSLHPALAKPPVFYSSVRCSAGFAPDMQPVLVKSRSTPSPTDSLEHAVAVRKRLNFPELRLIQYDCGKLQALDLLLRSLHSEGHRVLIFTQMSRMLDVLEQFLSYHGFVYLRLDGSTKLENRQVLVERFNQDKRIFCFILSTRAGGIGINLTGADTVIFYDSDWNPTTDAQAQDRCHRIGQTRDVHIYRLVSERTVEENVIKRAAQKRLLNELAIEGGDFTTARLRENALREIFGPTMFDDVSETDEKRSGKEVMDADTSGVRPEDIGETGLAESAPPQQIVAFEEALLQAEGETAGDEADVAAARQARREQVAENADNDFFLEPDLPVPDQASATTTTNAVVPQTPVTAPPPPPPPPPVEEPKDEVGVLEQQLRPVERLALDIVERFIVAGQQQQQQPSAPTATNEPNADLDATLHSEWELERLKTTQTSLVKKSATAGGGSTSDECSDSEMDDGESDQMDVANGNEFGSDLAVTYDRSAGQAWIDDWSGALLPVWLPPTPPSELQMDGSSLLQMDEFCEGCMCCCDDFDALTTSLSNPSVYLYHAVPMFDSELPPVCIHPPAAPMLSRIRAAIIAASPQVTRVQTTGEDQQLPPNAHRVPGDSIVSSLLADQINLPSSSVGQDTSAQKRKSQSRKRGGASLIDDCPSAPRSPFERPTAASLRLRDEMQRLRRHSSASVMPLPPGSILLAGKADQRSAHAVDPVPANFSLANALSRFSPLGNDWLISEEWGILLALSNLMDVPTSSTPVQPGHIANWDAVADFISSSAVGPFRAAKSCRQHFESTILPREDARQQQQSMDAMSMMSSESGRPTPPPGFGAPPVGKKRADKRRQQQMMAEQQMMPTMNSSERTTALNSQDGGASVTGFHLTRFTAALEAMGRFQPHCPHVPSSRSGSASRPFAAHCPLLSDIDWDNAMMPVDVAAHRLAARQSRRLQQHYQMQQQYHHPPSSQQTQLQSQTQLQQQQQQGYGGVPGSVSRSSLGPDIQMSPMDTTTTAVTTATGTPQHGRALSDLVKQSRNNSTTSSTTSANITIMQTSGSQPTSVMPGTTAGSLVDSLLISTPSMSAPNPTVAMSHPYNQQQSQPPQAQSQQQNQTPGVPTSIVRQQSGATLVTTATATNQMRSSAANGSTPSSVAVGRPPGSSIPLGAEGSSVTRLLSAPSPSVVSQSQSQQQTSSQVQPSSQQAPTVYASRGAILSPAPSGSVLAPSGSTIITASSGTSTPTIRQAATPTARLQLMPSSGVTVTSSPITRVASAGNMSAPGGGNAANQATTTGAAPSPQVAQLRLQVAASAAQAALNRSTGVTSGGGGVGTGGGEVVSVVVTGAAGSGTTFGTGALRGTPVEALLRRSPTVLSANTIRGQGGMRHITQLLPPTATGSFVTVQQQQQQQLQQQPSQIVSISSAGQSLQGTGQPAGTIVLSAAGPAGSAHAYSQFRSSPQPRPGLTAYRYADASGISSVRLAGGASVSAANLVSSPLRQQMTAVRPTAGVLTVTTAPISTTPAVPPATTTQTPGTTVTATPASIVSASCASSGQQQASPPVHLVATHQFPSSSTSSSSGTTNIQSAASSATPTLSNALTGGRVSMPPLTLGNTTSRLQQQLDAPNVVVSSDEEDDAGGAGDDDSGESFSQSVALPPTRGRPPTRRLQRGGGTTRGATRGGTPGGVNKPQAYRRH